MEVEIACPITLARCIDTRPLPLTARRSLVLDSDDSKRIDQRASAEPREGEGGCHTLAGRSRDAEAEQSLASRTDAGRARSVFDVDRAVHFLAHASQCPQIVRVDDGRVSKAMLVLLGQIDGGIDVLRVRTNGRTGIICS